MNLKLNEIITMLIMSLFLEAGVIGVICVIFLILFVVAGIRQKIKEKE